YWESVDNVAGVSDLALNAQSLTTQAILTIDYTIPSEVKWYTSALGGTSFYTGPVMNPFSIPASGLSGTSITGNYSFYAACASDTLCRVPVTLKIKASPQVVQDSLSSCEMISSTGNGSFNLTTLNSSVSAANPLATVTYFQDLSLSLPITNPLSYVAGTSYVYSKVEQAGCYSSDTVYLQVFPKPDFGAASVNAFACIPDFVDAAQLIDPFSLVPPGTDTLYFEDALYSIPHLNPHWITTVDTVYILFETNSIPVCRDSAIAYVNVMPMNNYIVNQDTLLNFSVVGSVGCSGIQLSDGQLDTLHSVNDCARIASVLDWPDGTSLGNTLICEEIEAGVPFHNGQPYVNRHYSLSPATIDSATVCLYFLDDDLQQYNNAAFGSWPLLPTSSSPSYLNNLCFSRVSNGDLNTPGHIAEVIPHTAITSSYDPATTVWTFCFTTDSFGYFYLHAQNPFNIPLAVSDFQWQLQGIEEGVRIQWSCATEEKMAHYQIERSTDGIHFQVISPVIPAQSFQSGSQVNQASYVWMDDQPGYCQAQYRIRLTDIENTSWYSSVKTNKCIDNESINLFPNPVSDQIQFTVNTVEEGLMLLDIFDLTGRRIHSVLLNTSPGSQKGYVDCTQWETGWYSWKGQLPGGKTFSGKLLKKYN
ncbi:MAG TPA: hypothetical protein PLP34_04115, partial [Chitinophagaceae bacterium]|nr:hypothetical protein [Chitinophagaceae bacterium]